MKQISQFNIQNYVEIALRRKWLIILPFILITIGGTIGSYFLPTIYQASTLILVQAQRVPATYVQPTVVTSVQERLQTISQEIFSRTRLETIIGEFKLYRDLRKTLFMEEVVEKMRKDISLKVKAGNAFELFYEGKDPKVVAMVANRLASLFMEENLKTREAQAEGTSEFLDRELTRANELLESQEKVVREFKERGMGSLPGQMEANLRSLDQSQLQLQTVTVSLQNARDRKVSLQNQISSLSNLQKQGGTNLVEVEGEATDPASASLGRLKEQLDFLLVRYKEKHPEVIRVKSLIKKLEEENKKQKKQKKAIATSPSSPAFNLPDRMTIELEKVEQEIRRLSDEQSKIKGRIVLYQRRVEDTPKREEEFLALERDYGNTRKHYDSLLDKKLNAQLATNMEKEQKGERFKVLDLARIPEKPYKPNRPKIFLLTILLGLGFGVGLAFGVEYLDHSFRDIDDLEEYLGLSVLASIPRIVTDEDIKKEKFKKKVLSLLFLRH